MIFIIQILWINFILFIWFETDGFIQYSKLFRLGKLFKINEFLEYKEDKNPKMNYLSYIRQKHNNFFTKLITCVPCYNFWIVLLVVILINSIYLYPLIYLTSYSLYKILKKYVY